MTSARVVVEAMGRSVLVDHIRQRRDGLHRRWSIDFAPIAAQVAKHIAAPLAHQATAKQEDAIQRQEWTSSAEEAIGALADSDVWQEWRSLMLNALLAAQAEGRVDAIAWLQHLRGEAVASLDVGFGKVLAALQDLPPEWSDVDTWMGRAVHGMAYDVGRVVAAGIDAGQGYDELLAAIRDVLGDVDGDGVVMLNELISTGVSQGSLMQYGDDGLSLANILTSPGACEECEALEAQNPWPLADAEGLLPDHVNCRCAWEPVMAA